MLCTSLEFIHFLRLKNESKDTLYTDVLRNIYKIHFYSWNSNEEKIKLVMFDGRETHLEEKVRSSNILAICQQIISEVDRTKILANIYRLFTFREITIGRSKIRHR